LVEEQGEFTLFDSFLHTPVVNLSAVFWDTVVVRPQGMVTKFVRSNQIIR